MDHVFEGDVKSHSSAIFYNIQYIRHDEREARLMCSASMRFSLHDRSPRLSAVNLAIPLRRQKRGHTASRG